MGPDSSDRPDIPIDDTELVRDNFADERAA